jgi:hypothetical protein
MATARTQANKEMWRHRMSRPRTKIGRQEILSLPYGFCEGILGFPRLYPWQQDTLSPFVHASGPNARLVQVACASPNEGGRSSLIVSGLAIWWLAMHIRGKVGITTADAKQLNEQILPSLHKAIQRFPKWKEIYSPYYRITTDTGGRLIAFTTNDAGRVEGLHKGDDIEAPLLWIIDEAKSVEDEIFQGIDRCSFNALLLASSCGLKRGRFFDAFTKNRAQFVTIRAGLKDCPHIAKEKLDRIVATYGLEHPFTRSSIFGEFMDQDELGRYILSDSDLRRCIDNPPVHKPGFRYAFCDFGGGHDENVIAFRDGNKIELVACWREANKEAAAGRFVRELRKLDLKPKDVAGDAADREMWTLLEQAGWPIGRQNFGAPSPNKDAYVSWGAEAWIEGAAGIARCEWILPDDETLFGELTTRMKRLTARGKLGIEEKYEMKKRNVPSPSRADAVMGVMRQQDMLALGKAGIDFRDWRDHGVAQHDRGVLAGIGASAGGF